MSNPAPARTERRSAPLHLALLLVLGATFLTSTIELLAKPNGDGTEYPGASETLQFLIDQGVDNPAQPPQDIDKVFAANFPLPGDDERTAAFQEICKLSGIHEAGDLHVLPPVLIWRIDLVLTVPRLSTANQVSQVLVRGYDPASKKDIVGNSSPPRSDLGLNCIESELRRFKVNQIADLTPEQFAELVDRCGYPRPYQFASVVLSWLAEKKVTSLQKLTDQQKSSLVDAFMASL